MRISTPKIRPAGIDHVLMRYSNLIRPRRRAGLEGVTSVTLTTQCESLPENFAAGNPDALQGSVWIDLFAGTGAVGIEALSRGAAMVYFVEQSRQAVELIKRNLESLRINNGFQILQHEAKHAISQLNEQAVRPGYVFLDPPYRLQAAYRETLELLA